VLFGLGVSVTGQHFLEEVGQGVGAVVGADFLAVHALGAEADLVAAGEDADETRVQISIFQNSSILQTKISRKQ
jgi:hypothetical protein